MNPTQIAALIKTLQRIAMALETIAAAGGGTQTVTMRNNGETTTHTMRSNGETMTVKHGGQ